VNQPQPKVEIMLNFILRMILEQVLAAFLTVLIQAFA
jgi:hypothetical protein